MRIFNLVFCVLFILFAALQYNDPDPYIWVPIYGYAAILCWLAFKRKYFPKAYLTGIVIYAAYAVYLVLKKDGVWDWLTQHDAANIAGSMKAESPWVEYTREFFGLVILMVVLGVDWWHGRRRFFK